MMQEQKPAAEPVESARPNLEALLKPVEAI